MKTYPMAFIASPNKIEFGDLPIRDPLANEVMIQVRSAAICGSDLHLYKGKHPSVELPSAVGHELSGTVLRAGKDVTRFSEGDRVTVEPVITCGQCYYCKRGQYHLCTNVSFHYRKGQGAFSEYFYAPEDRTYKISDKLSFEEGALIEPLSVALHAVKKSGVRLGSSCAVFGAGAIGLLISGLLKNASGGLVFVMDVSGFRLAKALEMGATYGINNQTENALEIIQKNTDGLGVDLAFEAVGRESTLTQALQSVRKGGTTTLLGIFEDLNVHIPVNLFIQREIQLAGSQGYSWDFEDAIHMVENGRINLSTLITHRFTLENIHQGFELLVTPGNEALKVVATL